MSASESIREFHRVSEASAATIGRLNEIRAMLVSGGTIDRESQVMLIDTLVHNIRSMRKMSQAVRDVNNST